MEEAMIHPTHKAELDRLCAEMEPDRPCCPRCGEILRGMYDLAIGLCGLCKDDELNKKTMNLPKKTSNYPKGKKADPYPKGRW